MSESDLVAQIKQYINLKGGIATRVNSGFMKTDSGHIFRGAGAGTSDLICCVNGHYVAIECKVGKNKTTPLQDLFLESVHEAGGFEIVAYSLDDVVEIIEQIS